MPQLPANLFKAWACQKCSSGLMVWFASDLRKDGLMIEHKFICDACREIERITVPFTPAAPKPDLAGGKL